MEQCYTLMRPRVACREETSHRNRSVAILPMNAFTYTYIFLNIAFTNYSETQATFQSPVFTLTYFGTILNYGHWFITKLYFMVSC